MKLKEDELQDALEKNFLVPYEQELVDSLRHITYESIPISISVLSFPVRNGNCHVVSLLLTKGMKNYKLVRGNVNMYPIEPDYPNHSWVEKDGYVYDPTEGCKYEKELYYKKCEVHVMEIYEETNIQKHPFYQSVNDNINLDDIPSNQLALILQYLKMLELEDNTINHYMLLDEIEKCRKVYGATMVYDDEVMQWYKRYMNEHVKG